jgi:hypothetical protein
MDKKKDDDQIHLFLSICLVALGLSLLVNTAIELFFSK